MAIVKDPVRRTSIGVLERIQSLTQASTATRVTNFGVTAITSAGSGTAATHGFKIRKPVKGMRKAILVDPNSTREVAIYNLSTTITFFGSTANALVFSTGAGHRKIELIGLSATQWGILAQSTGITLIGSTIH